MNTTKSDKEFDKILVKNLQQTNQDEDYVTYSLDKTLSRPWFAASPDKEGSEHCPVSTLHHIRYTGRERLIRTRMIRNYCEIFFYHIPNISFLKSTVNSNFHLIQSKTLLTNDFELTFPNL